MQKKIIALAVAAAASGAAFAQSNVQIYGIVDIGYVRGSSSDASTVKSRNAMDSGLQSGSRIGFRGTEDLGNGLKASFVLEYMLNNDLDSGVGGSRQEFLALSNQYGTVAAGHQYTPQHGLLGKVDPFGTGTVGNVEFNGNGVYHVGAFQGNTIRLQNLLAYVSPTFGGGFNVIAGYTGNGLGDEEATAKGAKNGDYKIWAINPNYANGPLFVGLNYHQVKNDAADYKDKIWDLGASYDFGMVKLSGVYGQIKNSAGTADNKTKQWMLGATVPVGSAGAVLVSYARNKTDYDAGNDGKANKWALGYTHSLSKRTNLYAAYAKIKTNDREEGNFSTIGTGRVGNDYTSGLNLGIRHSF